MLTIQHFSKNYGAKKAVEDLSLEVLPGDLTAFIGHNGAGKTTTLKAVAGIIPFEEGEIFIDGQSIQREPVACKRKLAYIPDNPDLYESLTGIQYLNFIADIFSVEKEKRMERVERYARLFEIEGNLQDMISSYSHGMKQKLAVISAFLHEPQLMLLDEPFVGLDPKAAFTLKGCMRDFCASGGAILYSTHVLEVAQELGNRVAIIREGRLLKCGKMSEITKDKSLEQVFLELSADE